MRVCPCGGIVRQHPLSNSREAWTCGACNRYEVVSHKAEPLIVETKKKDSNHEPQSQLGLSFEGQRRSR
jgi:hypothetical protein